MKRLVLALTFVAVILAAVVSRGWLVQNSTAQGVPTPGTATYKYDSVGQVVQDVHAANSGAYSYDVAGNRLTETRN
jgi:YD repeat-containing protein